MPSDSHVPTTLRSLLASFRPLFTAPTFVTFSSLLVGFLARVGDHTVGGMLTAAGLAERWHHSRAHRFFSHRRWSSERLGLQLARLIVHTLVPAGAPLDLVIDDTLFRRSGRRVFGARWCYDGSAPGPTPVGFGTCFVVLGIVVSLPFCSRPVCLPLLCSLWEGGSKVVIARGLVLLMANRFPEHSLHVAADAAYASRGLRGLPRRITWTTRRRKDAALYELAPPHTGRRGRPRTRGERLDYLAGLAATLPWTAGTVTRYGVTGTVEIAHRLCLWYRSFAGQTVHLVMVRTPRKLGFEIALVTTDLDASPAQIVERYATADMPAAARRILIAAQFSATQPGAPTPSQILEVQRAWAMAAA